MKDSGRSAPTVAARRRVRLTFAALAVVLAGVAAALIAFSGFDRTRPDVARFPGRPVRLMAADGRVWVTTQSPGAVWTLDARTARRALSPVRRGGTPGPLAVAKNGVWVADVAAAKVVPVRLRPWRVFSAIAVGADISDLALAAGALWVSSAAEGAVRVIEPGGRRQRRIDFAQRQLPRPTVVGRA